MLIHQPMQTLSYAESLQLLPPVHTREAQRLNPSDLQFKTEIGETLPLEDVLKQIPAATNVSESKALFDARMAAIRGQFLDKPVPKWIGTPDANGDTGGKVAYLADIKLGAGKDVARINQVLKSAYAFRDVGTHTNIPIFGRKGDYDFTLMTLTAMVYNHLNDPQLDESTKQHLIKNLLNQEGNDHLAPRWLLGIVPETENHILMTESSRYLKNQLIQKYGRSVSTDRLKPEKYDNQKNGFNRWFVDHLSQFVRADFDEYNSRPYQAYTVRAIQNMYDFAEDPKVQKSAHIVMDYISARFATQSSDLRRVVPFRRRHNYKDRDNLFEKDSQSARYALLAGNYLGFQKHTDNPLGFATGHMMYPSLSKYRVPDLLLDTLIDKGSNPYFMKAHHENTELVYAEENFLISAGGHAHDWSALPFSNHENGLTMPTVVMLKNGGPSLSHMIRFEGRGDGGKVNNTGVYENFASGIRPVFPDELEAELKTKGKLIDKGPWRFAEMANVYVAMYTHSQRSPDNYAPSVGFVEVVDKSEFESLARFQAQVEVNNRSHTFKHYGANRYTTSRGKTIEFVMADPLKKKRPLNPKLARYSRTRYQPPNADPKEWKIKKVWDQGKPVPIETRFDKWDLVDSYTLKPEQDGENNDYIVKADGTGQMIINNPRTNQSLLLSLADPNHPIRIEQAGEAINLSETAQVKQTKLREGVDITLKLESPKAIQYLSLPWKKGSKPAHVHMYILEPGKSQWTRVDDGSAPFTTQKHHFRSDLDLGTPHMATQIKFRVTGRKLNLLHTPEVYQAFPKSTPQT